MKPLDPPPDDDAPDDDYPDESFRSRIRCICVLASDEGDCCDDCEDGFGFEHLT